MLNAVTDCAERWRSAKANAFIAEGCIMQTISWNERFSVGVPAMDEQHKTMIDLINALQPSANADLASSAISGMFAYAAHHFREEEELLRQVGYSELPAQQREHQAFLSKATDFSKQNLNDPELCEQITAFLRSWMLNHILGDDMKYKRCIPPRYIR